MNSANFVQDQFSRYAYPEPSDDISVWQKSYNYNLYDPGLCSALYWPEGRPRPNLEILVAGCGTMQAAVLAFNNPQCKFTGVDFSAASVAHEERLRERHNLTNLILHRMDLHDVSKIGQSYDLIISSGVLHHLSDPGAGLRALASVLEPVHGVMVLMLYGRLGRVGVYALQDVFRRMRVPQSAEGVALVRSIIQRLPARHPARWYFDSSFEMKFDPAIVDTFLHPQDTAYSVQEVLDFVENNGLKFQDWLDSGIYNQDWEGIDPNISDRDRWSINEALSGRMTTHSFIVKSLDRDSRSQLNFEDNSWLSYYPRRHPDLSPSAFNVEKCVRGSHEFTVTPLEAVLIAESDGSRSVAQILRRKAFAQVGIQQRNAAARSLYKRMWRLGHLFFSVAPN